MTSAARKTAHLRPRIPHVAPKFVAYWTKHGGDWAALEPHFGPERIMEDHVIAGTILFATEELDGEAIELAQILKRMSYVQRQKFARELFLKTRELKRERKKNG